MSAIAGIYFLDGRHVDHIALQRMMTSVAHRGSDCAGLWRDGSVGLGHRMLWTTPESLHEKIPLPSEDGNLILTADARIDNRTELLSALSITTRPPGAIGDSELILEAYRKWGVNCPEKLLGDFAFVIWDARKQQLFCARDHFGVKQLYYYRSEKVFLFASEIKALLCLPEVPRRLNETRLADYLITMFEDKSATLYEDIFRLAPSHSLTVGCETMQERQYWSIDPSREVRFKSDAEYAEAYRHTFTEAVRCRLRSPGTVGSTLSGGLDSSAIACVARDILPACNGEGEGQALHTFSAVYDEVKECDERAYINAVVAQGGVQAHYGHPDRLSPLRDWEGVLGGGDEPLWNPQTALHWVLYDAAREQKTRVVLDGYGGDFVVSFGVPYLTELARTGRWIKMSSEAIGLSQHYERPLRKILWNRAVVPFVPEQARRAWRTLRRRNREAWADNIPIRADFARRIHLQKRVASFEGERNKPARSSRQAHWRELTSGLYPFMLGVLDRTAALFGIEARCPFFDRRLAELCLSLPPEQKMRRGWTRFIARNALGGILPETIRWRTSKASHSASFMRGLAATTGKKILEEAFTKSSGHIAKYVDMTALRQMYQQFLFRPDKHTGLILWQIAMLSLWLRRAGLENSRA